MCYGVMGAFMQPQGHLQIISNVVDFGMEPQKALNALRFMIARDTVSLEEGAPPELMTELERRGHRLNVLGPWNASGSEVMIQVETGSDADSATLSGAADPRRDGHAITW